MKSRKLLPTLALLLGLLLVVAGCQASAEPDTAPEETSDTADQTSSEQSEPESEPTAAESGEGGSDILRVRLITDIRDMDPAFETGATESTVNRGILEGLVGYKPGTYELENRLAESIEVSDDGLVIDFKLREGVQFHHGYGELTAEDVKFSYERYLDPELDATYKDDWGALDHVEVTGTYSGKIVLKEPYGPLWSTTMPYTAGSIISKKAMEDMGREEFKTHPIGTGPYEFAEHVPNQSVKLTQFEDYWGDAPEWKAIHYSVIPDAMAAEIALETNEVDFAEIDLNAVDRFRENPKFEVLTMPSLRYYWVGMNQQNPKLKDKNVRLAIRYGVDVNQILEGAFEGEVKRTGAIIAPDMVGYWKDAPLYERDVEKAREYLAAAGLESLDLKMAVEDRSTDRAVAEIVQAQLAEVGINVEIETHATGTFTEVMMGDTAMEQELHFMSFTGLHDPAWSTMWFICDQVKKWNYLQWCNEEFDNLHYEALKTTDEEKRHEMYIEMQKVWDEAANTIWLTHGSLSWAYRPDKVDPAVFPGTRVIQSHAFEKP